MTADDAPAGDTKMAGKSASPRRFFSDGAIYAVSAATGQLAPLLLVPIYVRVLAPAEIGLAALMTSLLAFTLPLAVLGLDSATGRMYWTLADPGQRQRLLSTWFWTQAGTSLALWAGLVLAAAPLAAFLGSPADPYTVRMAATVLPIRVVAVFLNNWFRTQRRPQSALAFNLVLTTLTVAGTLVLLLRAGRGVAGIFEAQAMALAVTCALWGGTLVPLAGHLGFDRPLLRRMLGYSLPLVPAATLGWLSGYADRWVLGTGLGLADVGIYQIGVYAAMAVGLPVVAFGQAWGPFAFQVEGRPEAPRILARIARMVTTGVAAVAFLLAVWAGPALGWLAGDPFRAAAPAAALLGFGQALAVFTLLGALQCNLGNDNRPYLAALAVAAATSVAFNLALVPPLGVLGAAIANLLANGVGALLLLRWSRKVHDLHYPLRELAAPVVAFGALAAVALAIPDGPAPDAGLSLLGIGVALLFLRWANRAREGRTVGAGAA